MSLAIVFGAGVAIALVHESPAALVIVAVCALLMMQRTK